VGSTFRDPQLAGGIFDIYLGDKVRVRGGGRVRC